MLCIYNIYQYMFNGSIKTIKRAWGDGVIVITKLS